MSSRSESPSCAATSSAASARRADVADRRHARSARARANLARNPARRSRAAAPPAQASRSPPRRSPTRARTPATARARSAPRARDRPRGGSPHTLARDTRRASRVAQPPHARPSPSSDSGSSVATTASERVTGCSQSPATSASYPEARDTSLDTVVTCRIVARSHTGCQLQPSASTAAGRTEKPRFQGFSQ